jgi:hypothetical protein
MKFLNDRVPSSLILEIWDFGRIREEATGAGDHGLWAHNNLCAKTFQMSSHLFNLNHRNSSYACKSVFFLVRVLVKARFPDSLATDQKSQTVLLTTVKQQTYVENFSSLGTIAAEK